MKKETISENKKVLIGVAALVAVVALLAGVYQLLGPKTMEGLKTISIVVVDHMETSTVYELQTDAAYLQEAMEEAEGLTYSGIESEYGLMIDTVNGIRADYTLDGAYWSFLVNGEYGNYGIHEQPVVDGYTYQIVYTPAN